MMPEKPQLVAGSQAEGLPSSPQRENVGGQGLHPALHSTGGPWMEERRRSYVALLLITGAALYAAYLIYRPFLKVLFYALVLTIAFSPVHDWVLRRVRRPTLA